MKFIHISIVLVFAIVSSNAQNQEDRKSCSFSNDPHVKNVDGTYFDFQYAGVFCLLRTNLVKVSAQFKRCSPMQQTDNPACNCMIRMELNSFPVKFVEFNNCAGPALLTSSDVPLFGCSPTSIFNIHSALEWASLTPPVVGHPNFKCAPVVSGGFAIKTNFINPNDNVVVMVYSSPPTMSQIQVFPSSNYNSNDDNCLCGKYNDTAFPILPTGSIKEGPRIGKEREFMDKCHKAIINENVEKHLLVNLKLDQVKQIDKFVHDCALDAIALPGEKIGAHQLPFINSFIFDSVLDNLCSDINGIFGISENSALWEIIKLFCACEGKLPNRDCLVFGRCCNNKFEICIPRMIRLI